MWELSYAPFSRPLIVGRHFISKGDKCCSPRALRRQGARGARRPRRAYPVAIKGPVLGGARLVSSDSNNRYKFAERAATVKREGVDDLQPRLRAERAACGCVVRLAASESVPRETAVIGRPSWRRSRRDVSRVANLIRKRMTPEGDPQGLPLPG